MTPKDDAVRSTIMLCSANPIAPDPTEVLQGLVVLFVVLAVVAVVCALVLLRRAKRHSQLTSAAVAPADDASAPVQSERR